jgi:hypothetical protein
MRIPPTSAAFQMHKLKKILSIKIWHTDIASGGHLAASVALCGSSSQRHIV